MFNKLVCLLVKSIAETLKCLIFLILSLATIGLKYEGKESFIIIGVSGFILYLLVTAAITFINKNSKMKSIKTFSCIVISFIISFSILKDLDWQYKPFCVLYLLGIMIYATIHYSNEIDNFNSFVKRYGLSVGVCLLYTIYMQSMGFMEVIKICFPMYLIMSIIYIVQTNILEEYKDYSANLINENRNIRRFDFIAISITAMSVLTFTTDFFKKVYGFANYIFETLIYILVKPVGIIIGWWCENILQKKGENIQQYYKIRDESNKKISDKVAENEEVRQKVFEQNQTVVTVIRIFLIIIFIIVVCAVVYYIYKKMKDAELKCSELDRLDGEERSFVFRKDKLGKAKKNRDKENLKDLHVIRRIYIDVIKTLKSKGVEYNSSYTPNEYTEFIENTEFKSKNINQLVNIYNSLRYGNKNISKEDISIAYKIKENL